MITRAHSGGAARRQLTRHGRAGGPHHSTRPHVGDHPHDGPVARTEHHVDRASHADGVHPRARNKPERIARGGAPADPSADPTPAGARHVTPAGERSTGLSMRDRSASRADRP